MSQREPRQPGQGPGQIQNQQPGTAWSPQQPAPPSSGAPQWGPPPQQPVSPPQWGPPQQAQPPQQQPQPQQQKRPERDPAASLTLFRTGNFFVHAFTPRLRTGTLSKAGGEGTILERIRWTSAEKQRLVEAQTRLLPQIDTFNAAQWREIPIPVWLESAFVALVLAATLVVQALNVFNFPAYTSDEGTFMSDAWAILQGKIAPYTYTYDHPPLGWVQIAAWAKLTGGIASFGNAINSGRILMLVLAVASSLLLYLITSRLTGSRSAALLALILYSLSPLSLIFRHEVLLYNIATFWLLLSLTLITTGKSRLATFVIAGVALGIAILTEGLFLFFIPVMLYAVALHATEFQRKFSLVAFIYITLAIASAYALLALLRGELLPAGDPLIHPTLIGTILQKLQEQPPEGQFGSIWNSWLQVDWLFIIAGVAAMFINILGGTVNRFQLLGALFAATFLIILIVSKNLYSYSIVPLLPFLALNIALALNTPLRWLTRKGGFDLARVLLLFILVGVLVPASLQQAQPLLSQNPAQPQRQALLWIGDNVSRNAVVITDSYLFTDLRDPQGMAVNGGQPFTHAQIYTDAVLDPDIAQGQLQGNWQKINFLVVDSNMLKTIRDDRQYRILNEALHHAILRMTFGSSADGTLIQVYQVITS